MTQAEGSSAVPVVQSLDRGLAVIRAFDAEHSRLTLSEVARRSELTRASARRFLHTLVALDYMQTDGRLFWLRPKVLELGYAYLSSLSLPELATPHLKDLSERLHESSSVAVLDGADVVYVARIPARRIMAVAINVGTRFPAHITSLGRALLAPLPREAVDRILEPVEYQPLTTHTVRDREALEEKLAEVRREGYALVDQELELGLRSIAVAIGGRDRAVHAAVNISVPATAVSIEEMRERILPALLATRDAIEADLQARHPTSA